jgi:signal transduction histidine kinase
MCNSIINAKIITQSSSFHTFKPVKIAQLERFAFFASMVGAEWPVSAETKEADKGLLESETQIADTMRAEKLAALGQLAAGVAHELGNPLSIISSSLQYLHERLAAANDPASDFTATALSNVDRMQGLIRNMLDSSAMRKPSYEHADLRDIVSEVLQFTAEECVRRGITVDVQFASTLTRIWVQPAALKQIFLNIIKNGLDAMVEKGNILRVHGRTERLEEDAEIAIVEIANNGPSIPNDVLPKLFRPFHTTKNGGTGLGLYLSRQIAKEHSGSLEVENRKEGGVCFTLKIPTDRRRGGNGGYTSCGRRT